MTMHSTCPQAANRASACLSSHLSPVQVVAGVQVQGRRIGGQVESTPARWRVQPRSQRRPACATPLRQCSQAQVYRRVCVTIVFEKLVADSHRLGWPLTAVQRQLAPKQGKQPHRSDRTQTLVSRAASGPVRLNST